MSRCGYEAFVEKPVHADTTTSFDPRILFPTTLECLQLERSGARNGGIRESRISDILLESKTNALSSLKQLSLGTGHSSMHGFRSKSGRVGSHL